MEIYLRKLANHANMSDKDPPEASLGWNLWQANRTQKFVEIERLRDDILQCLEQANIAVNGVQPSKRTTAPVDKIPRELAIYVCEIVQLCYEYAATWEQQAYFDASELQALRQTAWMILQAWRYLVHGDIDSIISELKYSDMLE